VLLGARADVCALGAAGKTDVRGDAHGGVAQAIDCDVVRGSSKRPRLLAYVHHTDYPTEPGYVHTVPHSHACALFSLLTPPLAAAGCFCWPRAPRARPSCCSCRACSRRPH
jgi:hypothetical protein